MLTEPNAWETRTGYRIAHIIFLSFYVRGLYDFYVAKLPQVTWDPHSRHESELPVCWTYHVLKCSTLVPNCYFPYVYAT